MLLLLLLFLLASATAESTVRGLQAGTIASATFNL
jgi:hypothetical protein